jgi:hypothetical protein
MSDVTDKIMSDVTDKIMGNRFFGTTAKAV